MIKNCVAFDTSESVNDFARSNVHDLGQVQQGCYASRNVHVVIENCLFLDSTRPAFNRMGTGVSLTSKYLRYYCMIGIDCLSYKDDFLFSFFE